MSLVDCIENAFDEGTITADQRRNALDLFTQRQVELEKSQGMGKAEADAQAGRDTFDALKYASVEKQRKQLAQIKAWKQIELNVNEYRDRSGNINWGRAALAILEEDRRSKFSSVKQRVQAVENQAIRNLDNFLVSFKRNLLGAVRNKAKLDNMVREIFGKDTGDVAAREMARAWSNTAEKLRQRFNAAGGSIAKRIGWGLPQTHDAVAIRKVGPKEWVDFVYDRLDHKKMIDEQTGQQIPLFEIKAVLYDVYENIVTDGLNKFSPSRAKGGKSLGNRRTDHRFLIFETADGWLEYSARFAKGTPFDVMIGHIKSMSRDIGQMEILGPNPASTIELIKQNVKKSNATKKDGERRTRIDNNNIDQLYSAVAGRNDNAIDSTVGAGFAGLRQILQAAQLGMAAVLATTDLNFQRIARRTSGLSQVNMIGQYFKLLQPLGRNEQQKLAVRLGLISEGWLSIASAQQRFVGEISGPEITRRIGDFVMRASGLSPWTQAGRWAFGMEFLGNLADNVGKTFDQLDPQLRQTLKQYGIENDSWNIMRSTDLYEHKGATFLRAEEIEARTDISPEVSRKLSTRLMEMVDTETNFAVPSTSYRGRAFLTGDTKPGTIAGEMTRSFAMYKNFGVTLVHTHIMRGLSQVGFQRKGMYLADMVISATIMGGLAMQMKEMAKGRDPRPMNTPQFWGAAFMQGGGLGIFGDFMFWDINRYGKGLPETVAGPVVGFVGDLNNLTTGNILQAISGEDTNFSNELINFIGRYTPGSSLWYMRLAMERNILDRLKLWADPVGSRKSFRRNERTWRKNYGQKFWWRPGKLKPDRLPNIYNAFN
ncbi:MAG: hypothetical protein CMB77_02370 [Euryarchaeota archaeon]|nr:hypothetical protein [Euryarchaeota archaeon]